MFVTCSASTTRDDARAEASSDFGCQDAKSNFVFASVPCHLEVDADFEWKIVVADDGSTDGTLQYLEAFSSAALTLIRNRRRYAVGQFNSILEQIVGERYDVCFMADDDVLFLCRGWEQSYLTGIERSGHHHLCWFDRDYWHLAWPLRPLPDGRVDATGTCAGSVRVQDCLGAFFTVTPQLVETVGYADEVNFPVRGQWHVDYSMRCVRAGWNEAFPFYDAIDGHRMVSVQDLHRRYPVDPRRFIGFPLRGANGDADAEGRNNGASRSYLFALAACRPDATG
jgi:glycosyltransferase involved in cell wall biosynthesis